MSDWEARTKNRKYVKLNILCIVSDWNGDNMNNGLLQLKTIIELNDNNARKRYNPDITYYDIMHGERKVAEINMRGEATILDETILDEKFIPYDLYLENDCDFDTLINNMNNFYHWCASRVLSLDRKYAKEILNSIGMAQAMTDRDRAKIALSYHCVSLTDVYWVKKSDEDISYEKINLYDNSLNEAVVELSLRGKPMTVTNQELAPDVYWVKKSDEDISYEKINLYDNSLNEAVVELSLRGKPMTVTNQELAPDLSTKGCFPKAWIRRGKDFILLKDGGDDAVQKELLASRLCQCFDFKQVKYDEDFYDGQKVTQSKIITSRQYSIVSKMAFEIYALNHDLNVLNECLRIDKETYYGMNILDYLVGNIDRHPENWGFLVDNRTNEYVSLYPIMDFNQSFGSYDTIDGANCQTVYPEKKTQREAAIEAVRHVGLHQIKDIDEEIFEDMTAWKEMFFRRLEELKNAVDTSVFR